MLQNGFNNQNDAYIEQLFFKKSLMSFFYHPCHAAHFVGDQSHVYFLLIRFKTPGTYKQQPTIGSGHSHSSTTLTEYST